MGKFIGTLVDQPTSFSRDHSLPPLLLLPMPLHAKERSESSLWSSLLLWTFANLKLCLHYIIRLNYANDWLGRQCDLLIWKKYGFMNSFLHVYHLNLLVSKLERLFFTNHGTNPILPHTSFFSMIVVFVFKHLREKTDVCSKIVFDYDLELRLILSILHSA